MTTFALVDGNSFYASCERAFDPRLKDRAIIILSNNDGCVIARTAEAKALGIRMGEPWHEVKRRPECRDVVWFSSNYALYADLSRRVFEVLESFSPDVEPYSIDEMFMGLDGHRGDLRELGLRTRSEVLRTAKIPTCVGIGPTKTIAKLANKHAKGAADLAGVCDLRDEHDRMDLFRRWPVEDVWGSDRPPRSDWPSTASGPSPTSLACHFAWSVTRCPSSAAASRTSCAGTPACLCRWSRP